MPRVMISNSMSSPGWYFDQVMAAQQHDHHIRNWITERAIWAIYEALSLHNTNERGERGLAEWYEYAAAGEWQ